MVLHYELQNSLTFCKIELGNGAYILLYVVLYTSNYIYIYMPQFLDLKGGSFTMF